MSPCSVLGLDRKEIIALLAENLKATEAEVAARKKREAEEEAERVTAAEKAAAEARRAQLKAEAEADAQRRLALAELKINEASEREKLAKEAMPPPSSPVKQTSPDPAAVAALALSQQQRAAKELEDEIAKLAQERKLYEMRAKEALALKEKLAAQAAAAADAEAEESKRRKEAADAQERKKREREQAAAEAAQRRKAAAERRKAAEESRKQKEKEAAETPTDAQELSAKLHEHLARTSQSLGEFFTDADADGSGQLDAEELRAALRKALGVDLSASEINQIVQYADQATTADGRRNGLIDYREFLSAFNMRAPGRSAISQIRSNRTASGAARSSSRSASDGSSLRTSSRVAPAASTSRSRRAATKSTNQKLTEELQEHLVRTSQSLGEFFREADADGSGELDAEELRAALRKALGVELSASEINQIVQYADQVTTADGRRNGLIDYREFLSAFNTRAPGRSAISQIRSNRTSSSSPSKTPLTAQRGRKNPARTKAAEELRKPKEQGSAEAPTNNTRAPGRSSISQIRSNRTSSSSPSKSPLSISQRGRTRTQQLKVEKMAKDGPSASAAIASLESLSGAERKPSQPPTANQQRRKTLIARNKDAAETSRPIPRTKTSTENAPAVQTKVHQLRSMKGANGKASQTKSTVWDSDSD
eukprot:SAG31_NODE_969_length_10677_cov_7.080072_8_plen_655_part_00